MSILDHLGLIPSMTKKGGVSWEGNAMLEHVVSMCKTLSLINSTTDRRKERIKGKLEEKKTSLTHYFVLVG